MTFDTYYNYYEKYKNDEDVSLILKEYNNLRMFLIQIRYGTFFNRKTENSI